MKRDYAAPLTAVDEVRSTTGPDGAITVTASKRIVASDPYLAAHFPGRTVYPGVFVLETVRQAVLSALPEQDGELADLSAVHSMRFFRGMHPGELMDATVTVQPAAADGEHRAEARCTRDGLDAARLTLGFRYPGPPPPPAPDPGPLLPAQLVIGHDRVRQLLPHGPELLLVDRAEIVTTGAELRAIRAVNGSELCYHALPENLPDSRYAYPLSLVIESFGQAAVIAWNCGSGRPPLSDELLMFAAARKCRFEGRAHPGDVLRHEVRFEHAVAGTGFASGETWAGGRRIATYGSLIAVARPPALTVPG